MTFLAIDQGTTSTRAFAVSAEGGSRQLVSLEHRQVYPRQGWVEHDPDELVGNLRACLEAAAAIPDLMAVGIANQGESCLAWDAQTLKPLGPVIVWQDARTEDRMARMKAEGAEALTLERAGLPLDPYFSASKLSWLLENRPDVGASARAGTLRLGTTDAYFRHVLTGRCETDVTTASRTSLMSLDTCTWDADLCALFGVPLEALPEITSTTGALGEVSIGGRTVPLSASVVDQQAAVYGHGCRNPGDAKITFGTGAFALAIAGPARPATGSGLLPTVAWAQSGRPPVYAVDGGVYAAASAVNWARSLGLFSDFAEVGQFATPPAISRGLAFVPALAGLACPHWDRRAAGAWMGMTLDTTKADLVQALFEGIAFRMAEVFAAMEAVRPVASPVSIDGGLSRNSYFCRFLATALGREILVSDEAELTALGTAALAADGMRTALEIPRRGRIVVPERAPEEWYSTFAAALGAVRGYGARGG